MLYGLRPSPPAPQPGLAGSTTTIRGRRQSTLDVDSVRVFSKHELARRIWRGQQIGQRTVDSHIARLRTRPGAGPVLITRWGQGCALTSPG